MWFVTYLFVINFAKKTKNAVKCESSIKIKSKNKIKSNYRNLVNASVRYLFNVLDQLTNPSGASG